MSHQLELRTGLAHSKVETPKNQTGQDVAKRHQVPYEALTMDWP